ncbi:MAG: protein kinase, partial [Gammaproteobacteria bacterium]|nr:protein kinase [Gammaproteobacteria bacterium]
MLESPSFMETRSLAHYQIREKLGEGGMGAVYLALDTRLGRDVALKVLPKELADDPDRRARFEREARAIAALKHPNIVTLYSVEEADGVVFITMEHVEGGTLVNDLEGDGLSLEKFFDLAIPIADALATAHGKGIVHRDIKPANIMRDAAGRVKILDFGLAKMFDTNFDEARTIAVSDESATAEGYILGTVAYMSPEQAEGKPVDARSDVFSLGVVLYEMATGKRPFRGQTNISTISAILKEDPPSVDDLRPVVPRHLGRIIQRCLAKEPDRRYQSALDVRNELEALKQETTSGMKSQNELRDAAT